jgi:hypothetical protein
VASTKFLQYNKYIILEFMSSFSNIMGVSGFKTVFFSHVGSFNKLSVQPMSFNDESLLYCGTWYVSYPKSP